MADFIGPKLRKALQDDELVPVYTTIASIEKKQDPGILTRQVVGELRQLLRAAEASSISPAIKKRVPSLLLTEQRSDGGANRYDTNNKDSVAHFNKLRASGFSTEAARFGTALFDAERRGKEQGRDPFEAWNGYGIVKDEKGKTVADAKNHARKVEAYKDLINAPENALFKRLLEGVSLTKKDQILETTVSDIANLHLGSDNFTAQDRQELQKKIFSHLPMKEAVILDSAQRSKDSPFAPSSATHLAELLRDQNFKDAGVKKPAGYYDELTPELEPILRKVRHLNSPEMKETPKEDDLFNKLLHFVVDR